MGGIESTYAAMLGGFVVGFAQVVMTLWLMSLLGEWMGAYRLMIPMAILIFVLLLEPRGLVGVIERLRATTVGKQIESRLKR